MGQVVGTKRRRFNLVVRVGNWHVILLAALTILCAVDRSRARMIVTLA